MLGFPRRFTFPATTKPKKAFELLGNSLHVGVASLVLAHALDGADEVAERAHDGHDEGELEAPRSVEVGVARGDQREAKRAKRAVDGSGMALT